MATEAVHDGYGDDIAATVDDPERKPNTASEDGADGSAARVASGWLRIRDYVLIGVITALVRAAYSFGQTTFRLLPDEIAVGGVARSLSGSGSWNMLAAETWFPGLALVLTPVHWAVRDPVRFVRVALVVQAAIAGFSAVYLAALAQRLTTMPRVAVMSATVAVCLLPAALSASSYVWAEPLVTLAFYAAAWYVLQYFRTQRLSAAVAGTAWAIGGFLSHGRLLLLVSVVAVVLVGRALWRHRWRHAVVVGLMAIAGAITVWVIAGAIHRSMWEAQLSSNTAGSVAKRLGSPDKVAVAGIGQLWYLLVSTGALFGLGLAVLIGALRPGRSSRPQRADAFVILALTVPLLLLSVVFMSGRTRPDYLVYGRYNDAIVGPVLIVAIGWLATEMAPAGARRWRGMLGSLCAVTLVLAVIVRILHGPDFEPGMLGPMIPGLQPITGPAGELNVLVVTWLGLGIFVVLLVLSGGRTSGRRLVPVFAGAVLAILAVLGHPGVIDRVFVTESASDVSSLEGTLIRSGEPVMVRVLPDVFGPELSANLQVIRVLLYEWYLPDHEFRLILEPDVDLSGALVVAHTNDPFMKAKEASLVWTDPEVPMSLWRVD